MSRSVRKNRLWGELFAVERRTIKESGIAVGGLMNGLPWMTAIVSCLSL